MALERHVRLDSVAQLVQGGRHGKSGKHFVEDGYPAYGAGGLNGYLSDYEYERPAVVLSSIGARCGKCFYADGRWSSLANTQVILPDQERVDAKFLWYQLNDEKSWRRSGTAQPFIKPSHAKARMVYIPPLADQRRIVSILDGADTIRRQRERAITLAEEIPRSVFLEMFGDPNHADNAHPGVDRWVAFDDLIEDVTAGNPKVKSSAYLSSGALPVIDQGADEIAGYVDDTSLRCRVSLPVVLFGDHTRSFKFVDYSFVLGADGVKVLRPIGRVDPRFAFAMLRLLVLPEDAGYSRHFKFLKTKRVPVPAKPLHDEFCRAFECARTFRAKLTDVSMRDRELFESLAQRAFRGEI